MVVLGASGGCGASTLACGLALAWAAAGVSPWLVEWDALRADLAGRWDLPGDRTILDLAPVASELRTEHVESAAALHPSGVAVLLGPPHAVPQISADLARSLLDVLDPGMPVVVDLAAATDSAAGCVLSLASTILMVAPSSASGARRARRIVDAARERGAGDRMRLVARAAADGGDLGARALSRAVSLDLAAALPHARRDALAIGSGRWPRERRRGLAARLGALSAEMR